MANSKISSGKHLILRSLLVLLFVYATIPLTQCRRNSNSTQSRFVNSANHFALNFLKHYPKSDLEKNVVYSPFSIYNALNMLMLGITQNSKSDQELSEILGFKQNNSENKDELHEALLKLKQELIKLNLHKDLDFQNQNKLITEEKLKLKDSYKKKLKYVQFDEFKKGSKKHANLHNEINEWVSHETYGQIKNIVSKNDIRDADFIFTNAVYFRGKWKYIFDKKETYKSKFFNHGDESNDTIVDFMTVSKSFDYLDTSHEEMDIPNCQVLSLPFSYDDGKELSMVLLLPKKKNGLQELIKKLDVSHLNSIYEKMSNQNVIVAIPKFKFEQKPPAKEILKDMGLKSLFKPSFDFKRMTKIKSPIKIDKVLHKAKITIDEEGAEASAATVIIGGMLSALHKIFIANHPFLFIIRHVKSNFPLFIGTVSEFEPTNFKLLFPSKSEQK